MEISSENEDAKFNNKNYSGINPVNDAKERNITLTPHTME